MKGQFLIVQFLLFFLTGLAVFISVGNFFRIQSDIFREDVADSARKLTSNYFSSLAITLYDSCKQCDFAQATVKLENTTANYYQEVYLTSTQLLNVKSQPGGKSYLSGMHNLNESLNFKPSFAVSINPITLTYAKDQNYLEVE